MNVYYEVKPSAKIRIEPSSIIQETDSFIIVKKETADEKKYYERIDKERLELIDDEIEKRTIIPITLTNNDTDMKTYLVENKERIEMPKYNYTFGVDDLRLFNKAPKKTAGFISPLIHVGECDYIELSSNKIPANSFVETYIIDGDLEVPILLKEYDTYKEKKLNESVRHLFSAVEFMEKKTADDETYYEYTPNNNAKIYKPTNEEIRIKIVCRRESKHTMPEAIESINILKHGGYRLWEK